jgi:hypothetical protein
MLCNEASSGKSADDTREEVPQELQEPVSVFNAYNVLQALCSEVAMGYGIIASVI